jgi:ABC-2 type transport system permease protein
MPEPDAPLPGVAGLLARQLGYQARLLLRTPRAVAGGMLLPVLLLALRGGGPRAERTDLVAGLAVMGLLSTAYITHAGGLVAARESGVLKRWLATPLPVWCYIAGRIGSTVLLAVGGAAVTLAAATAFDDAHLHMGALPGLAGALVLGAGAWAAIGTAASVLIPTVEAAWPLLGLTYLPVVVLSGSVGAVSGEPGWLASVVAYLPAEPIIHGVGRAMHGRCAFAPHDLVVMLLWGAGGALVAHRWFRWEPS